MEGNSNFEWSPHQKEIHLNNRKRPAFPSPASCLPEEQQEELEAKIVEANALLLNLALSNKQSQEGRRASFEGLIGQWAEVIIIGEVEANPPAAEETTAQNRRPISQKTAVKAKSGKRVLLKKKPAVRKQPQKGRTVSPKANVRQKKRRQKTARKISSLLYKQSGRVEVAGRDFVLLKKKEQEMMIPFSKIQSVKSFTRHPGLGKEPALLDIDPSLRRSLMFKFGETVASSPELLHLFFRITLPIFLLGYVDKKVKVVLSGKSVTGIVHEVDKETITIITIKKEQKTIPLHSIRAIVSAAL